MARLGLWLCVGLCLAASAQAQTFPGGLDGLYGRQGGSLAYHTIDFKLEDDLPAGGVDLFAYDGPAYGVAYKGSTTYIGLAYGRQSALNQLGTGDADVEQLAVVLATAVPLYPFARFRDTPNRFYTPVGARISYRRARRIEDGVSTELGLTTLGLSAGLGGGVSLGKALLVTAQAMPAIGLATRAFDGGFGWHRVVDAGVTLVSGPVINRFGLALGYRFRGEVWSLPSTITIIGNDATRSTAADYEGAQHTFFLGLSW
ncbi:MAG: hypothetical protein AAGI71_02365 [Bacteroidota bacterium]